MVYFQYIVSILLRWSIDILAVMNNGDKNLCHMSLRGSALGGGMVTVVCGILSEEQNGIIHVIKDHSYLTKLMLS